MDNFYLSAVVREVRPEILGLRVARIFVSPSSLLLDLGLSDRRLLLASMDRSAPALYLSTRSKPVRRRDSRTPGPFGSRIQELLAGARLIEVSKTPLDRIVEIAFERAVSGESRRCSLVLALTGGSANAYLLDHQRIVVSSFIERPFPETARPSDKEEPSRFTRGLRDSMTTEEIADRFFGAGSGFGAQLRTEFFNRSAGQPPAAAFRSLIENLMSATPLALVYSRIALEQIEEKVINPNADLLLSNIELIGARGMIRRQFSTLSEAADEYYTRRAQALALRSAHDQLRNRLSREIHKQESALKRIEADRARFGDPETLKRCGDLILANLVTGRLEEGKVTVVDYYDPAQAEIQIEIPEGATLEEAASRYFTRYRRARRASEAIRARIEEVRRRLDPLRHLLSRLEQEATRAVVESVGRAAGRLLESPVRARIVPERHARSKKAERAERTGRWFLSTDGYEIAVGRNDRDNDTLTFRVARSHDIWLHAADYPGSHVIIRNPARDDVPHRTIVEAAALAAFNSQARREGKAAVHYTLRKFVSKPPRSKPGLVRLSSFKTLLVEPRADLKRID